MNVCWSLLWSCIGIDEIVENKENRYFWNLREFFYNVVYVDSFIFFILKVNFYVL